MFAQRAYSLLLSASVLLFVASTVHTQYKLEICEDLKITEAHYGINTVETATCVNPTKAFSPKGTLRNVNVLYTFPKVPTGAGVTFMITKENAEGEYVQNTDYSVSPQHTTAYARFTINTPGKYFVRLANYYNKSQIWATSDFTIGADTVGPRSTGNTAAGGGKGGLFQKKKASPKGGGPTNQTGSQSPLPLPLSKTTTLGSGFYDHAVSMLG